MAEGVKKKAARKTIDMKKMSLAWCESPRRSEKVKKEGVEEGR